MEPILPCPSCKRETFTPHINEAEAFFLNVFMTSIFQSIARSLDGSSQDLPKTECRLCTSCNQFGFSCPLCLTGNKANKRPTDGDVMTCTGCSKRVMVRNPAHFLGGWQ